MFGLSPAVLLGVVSVSQAERPTVYLGGADIKDELFIRTDTCTALPADSEADAFCDVVAVGNRAGWHCTGVLVSPFLVLTARHCGPVTRVAQGHDTAHPLEQHTVRQTHLPDAPGLDVMLLELSEPATAALHPRRSAADSTPPSATLRAIGFGADVPTGQSGRGYKRGVALRASGSWGCDPLRSSVTGCRLDAELILGGDGTRDTCDGDSGGPVFEPTDDGWRLVALVSRPIRNSTVRCGGGGIYTRIDRLDGWLSAVIEQTTDARQGELEEG